MDYEGVPWGWLMRSLMQVRQANPDKARALTTGTGKFQAKALKALDPTSWFGGDGIADSVNSSIGIGVGDDSRMDYMFEDLPAKTVETLGYGSWTKPDGSYRPGSVSPGAPGQYGTGRTGMWGDLLKGVGSSLGGGAGQQPQGGPPAAGSSPQSYLSDIRMDDDARKRDAEARAQEMKLKEEEERRKSEVALLESLGRLGSA